MKPLYKDKSIVLSRGQVHSLQQYRQIPSQRSYKDAL